MVSIEISEKKVTSLDRIWINIHQAERTEMTSYDGIISELWMELGTSFISKQFDVVD